MDDITLTSALRDRGYTASEIRHRIRSGDLTRIRRGAYQQGLTDSETSPRQAHRLLIMATVSQCGADTVVSHASALVMHGPPSETRRCGSAYAITN